MRMLEKRKGLGLKTYRLDALSSPPSLLSVTASIFLQAPPVAAMRTAFLASVERAIKASFAREGRVLVRLVFA